MQTATQPVSVKWPDRYNELPKEIFHREDVYRLELERIFYGPAWHPVAHRAEVPKAGDYKTIQVGEAPLLVVHGDDGEVRVFLNSCPHRGTQLKTCSLGNSPRIECPYHRWTFSSTGELMGAPGMKEFEPEFRKENYGMRALRTATVAGLIFCTFDNSAPPIDQYLGKAVESFDAALAQGRLKLLGYQKVSFSANWKEYSDNEGYHAPLLHSAFRLLKWQGGAGSQYVNEYGHRITEAELQRATKSDYLNDSSLIEFLDPVAPARSTIISLFPMAVITKHLDVINIRYAFPVSQDETEVHYSYYATEDDDEEMERHRIRQASNLLGPSGLISLEDGAVFNRLHEGSNAPGTVAFQKGVNGPISAPSFVDQNAEASNLVKWGYYRQVMGF